MYSDNPIQRRQTRQIHVGDVPVGGGAPIAVQSMTNTETTDVEATVGQIRALEEAGRISSAFRRRPWTLRRPSVPSEVRVPLVADIHYDYRIALRVLELGVDCVRINPGNIGADERVRAVVSSCRIVACRFASASTQALSASAC